VIQKLQSFEPQRLSLANEPLWAKRKPLWQSIEPLCRIIQRLSSKNGRRRSMNKTLPSIRQPLCSTYVTPSEASSPRSLDGG